MKGARIIGERKEKAEKLVWERKRGSGVMSNVVVGEKRGRKGGESERKTTVDCMTKS